LRQEVFLEGGDAPRLRFAGGLFFAQQEREFAELQIQIGDGGLAVTEAGIEFSFSKVKDMGADFERLLLFGGGALRRFEFELGAAAAFVEGLHPQGFGDVGDGFRQSMEGGGSGVESIT